MSRSSSSAQSGTSLPPKVIGELIGTLRIRLLSINYHKSQRQQDIFARVQFWGEVTYVDLCLSKDDGSSSAVVSGPIEYPLVGSIHTLCSYLNDASPLKVTVLRQSTNHQPTESGQPEIVGYAYVQDLCIKDFLPPLNVRHENTQKSIKFVLHRDSQIVGGSGNDRHVIGEASFELSFRVLVCPSTSNAPIYTSTIPIPAPNPPPAEKCTSDNDNICPADDSSQQPSDIGGMSSSIEEKQSLLEELLELCCDDMTIPTVDSSNTCVDPYELWISRMIASASSPAKEFPSLLSAGSNQSHNLHKVVTMKLEVRGVMLSTRITNKLCGPENVFVLQYSNPPLAFDEGKALATTTNSVVCNRLDRQSNVTMMAAGKSKSTQVRPPNTGGTPLLKITYVKQMGVEFKNDDDVRLWLEGVVEFSLCSLVSESKLPRVARLVGKGKETLANSKSVITCCVAKASLSLRDIILSKTFSFHAKLPLLLLAESVHGEAGKKVGNVSVNIALSSVEDEKVGESKTSNEPAAATDEAQVSMKVRSSLPLTSAHHPISVLLSSFVGASNMGASSPQQGVLERRQSSKQTHESITPLLSVKTPSIWIDIRVERISKLVVDTVKSDSGCFKMGMSCSKPQPHEIETFGNGPQEIYTLTPDAFDDTHHHGAICSWTVPLDVENNRDKFTTIILHLWYCENESSSIQRLVGLTTIPFLLERIPGIVANSAFDLLDPKTHKSIGIVNVLVAAGLLCQVRALSAVNKSAAILQTWWRRYRSAVAVAIAAVKESQQNSVDTHLPSKEDVQQEDYDPVFDTIHAGFISQDVRSLRGQLNEAVLSPDSLFDEWSQQSISTISGYNMCSVRYEQGPVHSAKLPGGKEIRTGICLASSTASRDKYESLATETSQSDEEQLPEGEEIQICGASATASSDSLAEQSLALESPQDDEQDSDSDCKNLTAEVEATTAREHIIHTCDNEIESTEVSLIAQGQVMSTLKPMNLETSFAREQLDPPEEMKQEYCPSPSSKRLSNMSNEQRDNKRVCVKEFVCYYPQTINTNAFNHSSKPVNTQETNEESETFISAGEMCFDECDQSSDVDDAISYRSIGSMIGSLDNINSRLVARGAEPATKFNASYSRANSSDVLGTMESINEDKQRKHDPPVTENDESSLSSQLSKPVCPGRQIEPSEEYFVSRTPVAQQTSCNDGKAVNTSEKGTSPMSAPILSNIAASTSEGIEEANMLSDQDVPAATRHVRLQKSADRSPIEALMHHYKTTDRRRNGKRPNYSGMFHCHYISESVLSPPPIRDVSTPKAGQVLLEANYDKTFDKQRLERIFRNT